VVVLAIVVILIWWQWDRIAGLFGLSSSSGPVAEVLDYRCRPVSGGKVMIDGTVRNGSKTAIGFRAVTAIYDSSDRKSDYREATVRPSPLQPGQEGTFQTDGPPLPDGGYCKLDSIVDSDSGRPIHMTRTGR
jgi:hypothetical protein